MNIINNTVLTSISSLNTDKQAQTVLSNILASHASAKIDSIMFPSGNIVITKQDGTSYEFLPATLWLKYSSLPTCALVSAEDNFPRGIISRGFIPYAPLALITTELKNKVKTITPSIVNAKTVLINDIKASFDIVINSLKSTCATAINIDGVLINDYLDIVGKNKVLTVDGIAINLDNTIKQLNIEAMQETINQITSCFLIGKSEVDVNIIDANNIEVNLSSWDYLNNQIAIDKLKLFDINTCLFDSDKTGILKKLSVQIATIKL